MCEWYTDNLLFWNWFLPSSCEDHEVVDIWGSGFECGTNLENLFSRRNVKQALVPYHIVHDFYLSRAQELLSLEVGLFNFSQISINSERFLKTWSIIFVLNHTFLMVALGRVIIPPSEDRYYNQIWVEYVTHKVACKKVTGLQKLCSNVSKSLKMCLPEKRTLH